MCVNSSTRKLSFGTPWSERGGVEKHSGGSAHAVGHIPKCCTRSLSAAVWNSQQGHWFGGGGLDDASLAAGLLTAGMMTPAVLSVFLYVAVPVLEFSVLPSATLDSGDRIFQRR